MLQENRHPGEVEIGRSVRGRVRDGLAVQHHGLVEPAAAILGARANVQRPARLPRLFSRQGLLLRLAVGFSRAITQEKAMAVFPAAGAHQGSSQDEVGLVSPGIPHEDRSRKHDALDEPVLSRQGPGVEKPAL